MSVLYFHEDVPFPKIQKKRTSGWIKDVIISEGKYPGDISFIFCSDDHLLKINQKYLNHDFYTDVITFDYTAGEIINGDIFISMDRVSENAGVYSTPMINELLRVLIHGVLHLIGYKDKNRVDKLLMTAKEDFYLKIFSNSLLLN